MPLDDRVRDALIGLGLRFEEIACDEALADTAAFCAHYGYPEAYAANCIVVASKDPRAFAACVVLATTRLDVNSVVRKRLGAKKASFASTEDTAALTGMRIGGVTPFGLPDGVPLWIDGAVLAVPYVIVGGGTRSAKLKLAPAELLRIPGAVRVDGLAR